MMRISLWIPLLLLSGALTCILRSDFSFKPYDKARETSFAPHFVCDRKSDSLELVKLYNATGGGGWFNKWDLSKPITQWYGLSFTSDGCIQNISLQQNNLMGTWTDLNLPNLNFLDLRINKLVGTISNFKNSPLLHTLKLSHNKFYGNLPDLAINNRLLEFWVDDNNFTGIIPDFGANSPQLRLALFNDNKFTFNGIVQNQSKLTELIYVKNKWVESNFSYPPQQKIYADTTITIPPNTPYTLELKIDDTVTTSTYIWYKNDAQYKTIKGSNKLPFALFTSAEAGIYTVKITNPLALQLTLESWPIRLVTGTTCTGQNAGTFKLFGGGVASTNKIKYLCPGDTLTVKHNGDYSFVDPIPSTPPGIAYVYYDCKPTIRAKSLSQLLTDSCLNKTSPINNNGTPIFQFGGLWIGKGSFNDGNIRFYNDGYQQTVFNNGKPTQFWFAPVTVDNFAPTGSQSDFEGTNGIPGACIDLNADSAFSVVYLNALKLTGITGTNNGVGNYTGTFTATGGLPEFDTNANYTVVSIVNDRDPNAIGQLKNGPTKNGKAMNFLVPKPGRYVITIRDANGCSISSFVSIAQDPIDIKIACADGKIGDQICIPILIGKAPNLAAAQFTFAFNPQTLTFVSAQNANPKLGQPADQIVNPNTVAQGFIKFFWIDLNLDAHDFTNEEVLIEFCFTIKGPPGPTKVNIVPDPGPSFPKLELSNPDGNSLPTSAQSKLECTFNISPGSNIDVFYSQCGKTLFGQIFNGVSPYKIYYSLLSNPANIDSISTNQSLPFPIFSNNTGGDYILLTKDARGSILRDTFKYNAALNNLRLDLTNLLPESCKGGDGKVTVGITGGTPVYRQTWSTGSISPTIQGLKSGKYFVTVTDAQGCMATDSVVLTSERPKSAILIDRMPLCSGVSDGRTSPDFLKILGIRPYTFKWLGPGTMIGNAFTNLAEGRVGLVVIDAKGCSDTAYANIAVQKNIIDSVQINNPQCFNDKTGIITLSNRKFSDGSILIGEIVRIKNPQGKDSLFAIRPDIRYDGLQSGTYFTSIRDINGCTLLDTIEIKQPAPLNLIDSTIINNPCPNLAQGTIRLNASGGTTPYTYALNNDTYQNFGQFSKLASGIYTINISDVNRCPLVIKTELIEPQKILAVLDPLGLKPSTCNGPNCNGQASLFLSGGTDPLNNFEVRWASGEINQNLISATATKLCAGNQEVSIFDGNGCSIKQSFTINASSSIQNITVNPDQLQVKYQTSSLFDILSNDIIPNGSVLDVSIENPNNGKIIYSRTTGKGTYTPKQGFTGKEKLNYTVCATDCPDACKSSTIEFEVEAPCNDRNSLVLPNVIFPTGPTGANRYFIVEVLKKCPDAFGPKPTKLTVFNRWGDVVYKSNDYQNNWDGVNTSGQPLPEGSYYYLLDLGSQSAPVKGYVVIMR